MIFNLHIGHWIGLDIALYFHFTIRPIKGHVKYFFLVCSGTREVLSSSHNSGR